MSLISLLARQYMLQGVPRIVIVRAIAYASSECYKALAHCTLDLRCSSRSKKWSGHGLTGPTGSYAYVWSDVTQVYQCYTVLHGH